MACEFEICFPGARYPQGTELAMEALDLVETLEEQLSYFRPTSELNRINLLAGDGPVEVEEGLFELLRLAMEIHAETQGAYDITAAPLWEVWGFARRLGEIPSDAALDEARSRVGSQWIELDCARRTVRFQKPGMKLNLGSIGKGYALDRCVEHLLAGGMKDFLLHGGQSSVVARGSSAERSETESPADWEIGLTNPGQPGHRLGLVHLANRALGTSGGQFQSFRYRGRRYGHVLDPRTGWPAEGVLLATVLAPTAAVADALSTAFYVLGWEQSAVLCRSRPERGLIMAVSEAGRGVRLQRVGVGEEEFLVQTE